MPKINNYKCCICRRTIDYKPMRLVKQEYGVDKRYPSQYTFIRNYNFCVNCYQKFDNWVNRRKKDEK